MIIVFSGLIAQSGLGGQAWAAMQYLVGLRDLGHEVYYLEDCGDGPAGVYHWDLEESVYDLDYPSAYLQSCLEPVGFGNRWIYRAGDECRGMPVHDFREACAEADLLIMRAASLWLWRKEYLRPRRRAFIDVDPVFTQISLANGDQALRACVSRCERHFTVGLRIGNPECDVPTAGIDWKPTAPPVALRYWPESDFSPVTHFTTVMRWRGFHDAQYEGRTFGQKDQEFPRFLDLPRRTSQPFRVALIGADPSRFSSQGWEVVSGVAASRSPQSYQSFIQRSRAEFCVPKQAYAATRSGWMSDRTVCYLASGRPALVGDTGIGELIPTGEGFLTFRSPVEAVTGIQAINADYDRHRRAARALAEEWFAADKVLPQFLEAALD